MRKLSFLAVFAILSLFLLPEYSYGGFCVPTISNPSASCYSYGMDISLFKIPGDAGTTLNDASACSGSGYENHTATSMTVSLTESNSYMATLAASGTYAMDAQAWIDFNNDSTFQSSESVGGLNSYTGSTTFAVTIPLGVSAGVYRMRIAVAQSGGYYPSMIPCGGYYYGDYRDYDVTILALAACSGTPTAGTATSTVSSTCGFGSFTLNLVGSSAASALTYQWQSSPDGSTWTNISGATLLSYTTTESSSTYYRCVVNCTASSISSNSSMVLVGYTGACYCTPTYSDPGGSCATYGMDVARFHVVGESGSNINDTAACNSTGYLDRTVLNDTFKQFTNYTATIKCSGTYSLNEQTFIDFNDDGTFATSESVGGVNNYTNTGATYTIAIPAAVSVGAHRMRVVTSYSPSGFAYPTMDPCTTSYAYGESRDYTVYISSLPACTGMPAAGTVSSSTAIACPATAFTLTLSGFTVAGSLLMQWQSSPDSSTWSNISGATSPSVATTESSVTFYRCVVTCTASSLTSISPGYKVPYVSYCYCTPSYTQAALSCSTYNSSFSALHFAGQSGTSISDNTACTGSGYMDNTSLSLTYMQGVSYSATLYPSSGSALTLTNQIWIDFNDNGTFETTESVSGAASYSSTLVENIVLPITATVGAHRMRVVQVYTGSGYSYPTLDPCTTSYDYGEARDYSVTVVALPNCSGTPAGGTAGSSAATACPSTPFSVSVTGYSVASGISFQWQTSSDSSSWSNVTGATNSTFTTIETSTTYYRCITNCSYSSSSALSSGIRVPFVGYCYCVPAFSQSAISCSTYNFSIDTFSTNGVSGTAINDYAACDGSGYENRTSLSVTYQQGATYRATVSPNNVSTVAYTLNNAIWIDFNDNGTFDAGERVAGRTSYSCNASALDTLTIPSSATLGTHRMRIMEGYDGTVPAPGSMNACATTYSYGEARDYTVTITPAPCSGTPSISTVNATVSSGCSSYSSVLTLSGSAIPGLVYQWESSTDGTTYSNVSGATNATYTATVTSAIYYRCVVTCSLSGGSATTAGIILNFGPPTVAAISGASTVCQGATTAFSDATTGGSWSSSAATVASVTSGGVVVGMSGGSATISYGVGNSCGTTYVTKAIAVNPLPNAGTISGASSVCTGSSITLTDGTSGGTWSSTNSSVASVSTSGSVYGASVGSATISYSLTNSCGTNAATKAITVNLTPVAGTVSGASSVCVNSNITLTDATGTAGGTWTSSNAGIATVAPASGIVYGVTAGSATITYTIANSCGTVFATSALTVNPLPDTGTISGSTSFCIGSTITLTTTGAGGTWSSSNSSIASVSTSGVVSGSSGGSATISYTVTNVCGTASATHAVTVNLTANAGTITGPSTVCVGANITLSDAAAGGTWSSSVLSRATVNSSGVVTGLSAGGVNISYTVTSATCGTATVSYAITVNPLPSAGAILGSTTVCETASSTLTDASSGGTWSTTGLGNATISSSGVLTGIATGSDSVYYTVTNTCGSAVTSRGVTVNPAPSAGSFVATASALCTGVSSTFSATVSGGTWTSSATSIASVGSSTGTVYALAAGTATITYSVSNSCGTARITTPVTVTTSTPSAGRITGSTNVCASTSVTFTETVSGGAWSTADATVASVDGSGVVTGVAVGSTTITYTYTNTCGTAFTTAPITVSLSPTAGTLSGVTTFCQGSTNTLTPTVTGGTWSSSNISIATVSTSGVVYGVSSGTATISYGVSNVCGTAYVTKNQTVNPLPTVTPIGGVNTACVGFTSTLTEATSGGTWSSSNASIASVSTTGVVAGISAGSATITYAVTNSCGTTRVTMAYTVTSGISAGTISGSSTVCAAASTTLTSTVSGGSWSTGAVTIASVDASTGAVTGVAVGSVTITYTFTSSCGSTFTTYPMTVNPAPYAGTISGSGAPCPGATLSLTDATTGGTWSSADNTIATVDASTGVVTGVSGGVDTISYAVTNGCGTAIATYAVTISPAPNAGTITGPSTVCVGGTANLNDAITGGTWSSATTSIATVSSAGVVMGMSIGIATISYTVTNSCGTATTTYSINVNTTPSSGTITGASSVCVGASTTLADAVSGGTWRSSNSTIATVSTSGVVRGVSAGTVTISYFVITSCGASTATMSFTVNGAPSAGTITGTSTACIGTASTLADAVSGGIWSSSDVTIATVDASGNVTGVSSGTATISYQVTGTCGTGTATSTFVVNTTPTAGSVTGASSICSGTTTTFSDAISGGGWSSSDVTVATVDGVTGDVTGVSAGTATISYTVSSACGVAVATAGITVGAGSSAGTISGASSVCTGVTTTLTDAAAGGTWSTSDATIASVDASGNVTGVAAGTATISYTVTSGSCGTGIATSAITVNAATSAGTIFGTTSICTGSSTTLSDAVSGGTWSTSDATVASVDAVSGNVIAVAAGTATISYTVSDACGSAVATTTVTISATPTAGSVSGPSTACIGSSVTMTDAVAGGTWTSSNTSVATVNASGTVTGVAAGTATISYTVSSTCGSATATASITIGAGASAGTISGASTLCPATSTTLTDGTTGGTWSSSNASVATVSSTGVVTGVSAGSATISYTVTSSCGSVSATHNIAVNAGSSAGAITGATTLCAGSSAALADAVAGGTWSSSNTSVATVSSTGIITGVSAGSAVISYTISGSCGTGVATTNVTVNALPSAGSISGASAVCTGASTTLSVSVTGGTWSSSNTSIATVSTTGIVTGVGTGTTTISYTVTNSSGCTSSAIYSIASGSGAPSGSITPSGTLSLCGGSPVHLSVSSSAAGLAYQWYKNGVAISGATTSSYSVTSAGVYAAIINNGCGIDTIHGVTVLAAPNPVITLAGTSTLSTGSFATYQWYLNGVAISGATNSVYVYSAAGVYTVKVSNSAGCSVTSSPYTVSGSGGGSSGITEVNGASDVNVYPNPATSIVHIAADVKVNVVVLTAVGKTVIDQKDVKEVDLSQLADGMYMIMVYDENNTLLKAAKIIKAQ